MSYSFIVQAASKAEAKAAVEAEFDKVIQYQPDHAKDKAAVLANANALIDLLADVEGVDIGVSCNGYLSWNYKDDGIEITSASVSAQAYHAIRA